jgi:aquaporin Z
MAYAVGGISGGHFNPAVTVGLASAGRFKWNDVPGYVISQIVGGILGALVLYIIASGKADFSAAGGFASNGYAERSPGGYSMMAGLVTEVVMTAAFIFIILRVTLKSAPAGFAPISIGLALTLIHLISIPVTNTSVNPARSIGVAVFAGGPALQQLWLFIVAPIIGAIIGAVVHKALGNED